MRISDWSSDVCSSDLHLSVDDVPYPEDAIRWKGVTSRETVVAIDPPRLLAMTWDGGKNGVARFELTPEGARTRLVLTTTGIGDSGHRTGPAAGSAERRVGQEWVSTVSSRGSTFP